MPDQLAPVDCDSRARLLVQCIESFTTELSRRGYCEAAVRQKRATTTSFARWMMRRRLDVVTIDEAVIEAFLVYLGRRRIPIVNRRCTLMTFLEHLRAEATTARPEAVRDDSLVALLLQRYETYLREQRGLAEETISNYRQFVIPLVRGRFAGAGGGAAASSPGLQEVRDFLLARARTLAPTTAQLVATALRSFLRFLFQEGETAVDLALAVPTVNRWRHARVHPYLRPEEVERLLAACDTTTANGRRDHAMPRT